jgi:hypothetical protein
VFPSSSESEDTYPVRSHRKSQPQSLDNPSQNRSGVKSQCLNIMLNNRLTQSPWLQLQKMDRMVIWQQNSPPNLSDTLTSQLTYCLLNDAGRVDSNWLDDEWLTNWEKRHKQSGADWLWLRLAWSEQLVSLPAKTWGGGAPCKCKSESITAWATIWA